MGPSYSARRITALLVLLLTFAAVSVALWGRSPYWPTGPWAVTSRPQHATGGLDARAVSSRAQPPVAVDVAIRDAYVEVGQQRQAHACITCIPGCETSGDVTSVSSSSRDQTKTPASTRISQNHTRSLTCVARVTVLLPKRFVSGPVDPGDRLDVQVVARTAAGDIRTFCDDVFEVRLDGPALHVPPVTCNHATGMYLASMWLVEHGAYTLTVRLVETIQYEFPRVCFQRASPRGYVLGGRNSRQAKLHVREKKMKEAGEARPSKHNTPQGDEDPDFRPAVFPSDSASDSQRRRCAPLERTRPSVGDAGGSRSQSRSREQARSKKPHDVSSGFQRRRSDPSVTKSLLPCPLALPGSRLASDSDSDSRFDQDRGSLCRSQEFFSGRWVRSARPVPYPTGRSYRYEWRTHVQCDWPAHWPSERLRGVVRGRWVLFLGDSTTQEVATTFLQLLIDSPFNSSWNWLKPYYAGRRDARIYDAHLPNSTRVTFLWNPNEDPTVNIGYGGAAMQSIGFHRSLSRLLGPTGRPDAVILNSGLHDLYSMDSVTSFDQYKDNIRAGMKMVLAITDMPIWRQTSPKRHDFECGAAYKGLSGQASVQRLNQIAEPVATELNFTVVDQTQFNLAWYDSGKRHHSWQTQPCDLFALSFFNLFYERWRQ